MTDSFHDVSAAILAGGLGTRLRPVVADRPKPMAEVGGRPFLAYLLDQLARVSIREVVLLTGHGADQVRAVLRDRYAQMRLTYSVEPTPLGTAGAVRQALPCFQTATILLMNGDSYSNVDLHAFRRFHAHEPNSASLLLTRVEDASRFGQVQVDSDGRVVRFEEKGTSGLPGWINAGIYFLPREFIEEIDPERPASLERDVLPSLVAGGRLRGFRGDGHFIDIGTPESYTAAAAFFQDKVAAQENPSC